ncbi:MAG: Ig-like domain-containing protein [bacterium]
MLEHQKLRLGGLALIALVGMIVVLFANAQSSRAAQITGLATTRADATISADTAANSTSGGSWTTVGLTILLPFPMNSDVLLDLAPPTGWQFDTSGSAPTFTGNTCTFDAASVTSSSISTRAAVAQQCNNPNTIIIAGVRVQPTNGGTTASGNLTLTITSSSGSATDPNVGTLTIVPGVMTAYSVTATDLGPIGSQHEETPFTITIRAVDQFGTKVPSFTGLATLSAHDATSPFADVPFASGGGSVGPFVAGELSPSISFENPHDSIVLRVADLEYSGSSNAFTVLSTALPTTITLTAEPETTYYGDDVTLVATVTPESSNNSQSSQVQNMQSVPTGIVEFWANDMFLGSAELDEFGVATLHYSTLSLGWWTLHANYLGSDDYSASDSNGVSHQVIQANSVTTITAPTLVLPETVFAISAEVGAVGPATGTPTGWVNFYDGQVILGSAMLINGTATMNTSLSALGTHDLRADYQGDPRFLPSSSETAAVVVDTNATNLALTVNTSDPYIGQTVIFKATILPGNATGMIAFYDGATLLGTGTLAGGFATFITSSLPLGHHVVTAHYPGDTISAPASSNSVTVNVRAPETDVPPVVDDPVITSTPTPTVAPPTTTPTPGTPTTSPTNPSTTPTNPPSAATNTLTSGAPAGATTLTMNAPAGFAIGDRVTINPGGSNEETLTISGLNPLTFATPLAFSHVAGETIVKATPPATAEPLVPLPPATGTGAASSSTNQALLYVSGLALFIIAAGAVGMTRKRR